MRDFQTLSDSVAGGVIVDDCVDVGRVQIGAHADLSVELTTNLEQFQSPEFIENLDPYRAFELIGQIDSTIASLQAIRTRAIVKAVGEVAVSAKSVRKSSDVSIEDIRSTELGAYLRISPLAARNMAEVARDLVRWLPVTMSNFEVGNIDEPKARIVAEGSHKIYTNLRLINPEIVDENDERVLEMMKRYEVIATFRIARRTRTEVRTAVNKAIAQLTPLAEETRHEVGKSERGVEFFDNGDGMTLMQALMTNLEAAKVKNVLEFCARNDETLSGTMNNRMSDALVEIMLGDSDISPERRYSASQVNVVVSLETLLGASDAPATVIGSDFVLTASQVRELSENSRIRRMVVDPNTGALLELGRRSYEPSRQIKDFVKLRDKKCRAPGCVRNAMRCDVDHVKAWDDGGETNVDNLLSLCRRHHVLKTIGTWQYELKPNGDTVWRLPNSHVITDYYDGYPDPGTLIPSGHIDLYSGLKSELEVNESVEVPCPF